MTLVRILHRTTCILGASQVVLVAKNLPANTGDIRDVIRSLDQEDSLEEGMVTHFSALAWRNSIDREA